MNNLIHRLANFLAPPKNVRRWLFLHNPLAICDYIIYNLVKKYKHRKFQNIKFLSQRFISCEILSLFYYKIL